MSDYFGYWELEELEWQANYCSECDGSPCICDATPEDGDYDG